MENKKSWLKLCVVLLVSAVLVDCGATREQVRDATSVGVKTIACVLSNDHLPARDIALLCAVERVEDVVEMLTAARAAEDKHTLTALRALGVGPLPRASVTASASTSPPASGSAKCP